MQNTEVFKTAQTLRVALDGWKEKGLRIGFVPTMGALHEGHISLVKKAKEHADILVVSIFVNPTQFTNPDDLLKYPRTEDEDIQLLAAEGVHCVFLPSVSEMYPDGYRSPEIDLGVLDTVMEGHFRPGHFKGVVEVVKRFFEIVQPDCACFGKKDFQQLAVIRYMCHYFDFQMEIIGCDILREPNGLAMSSRNRRLSEEEKEQALILYRTLLYARNNVFDYSPQVLAQRCREELKKGSLQMEYLEIVHPETLLPLEEEWVSGATCCIAAYCGEVRLIDNMELV